MKHRIQRSMAFVLCITLVLAMFSFNYVIYQNNLAVMKVEVKKEILHIGEGINSGGQEYLLSILNDHTGSRITLIEDDGSVIMDTNMDVMLMDNHSSRKEVGEAIDLGYGSAIRVSDSLGTQTYYYAVKLDDGTILRVSRTTSSVIDTLKELIPSFLLVGFLVFLLAIYLSKKEVEKMIQPLLKLNLEQPLENHTYEELRPLLERIDFNNKTKEENEALRREFSANVSHELKTPLTSISGYAELMKSGLVRSEDIPGFSEKIHTEANRLVGLIEDIIRISHLDEKGMEMEKAEVDLFVVMRDICTRLSYLGSKRNIQISMSGSNAPIVGVKSVLDEMLYNITENAVKYNKDNGKVDIWVGVTLEGVRVVVMDTGIGIPEEEQERIFERFYRVDKSHSKETGGTGLGLSIVKHGARLHNAEINVESQLDKGTKITIDFEITTK